MRKTQFNYFLATEASVWIETKICNCITDNLSKVVVVVVGASAVGQHTWLKTNSVSGPIAVADASIRISGEDVNT